MIEITRKQLRGAINYDCEEFKACCGSMFRALAGGDIWLNESNALRTQSLNGALNYCPWCGYLAEIRRE